MKLEEVYALAKSINEERTAHQVIDSPAMKCRIRLGGS